MSSTCFTVSCEKRNNDYMTYKVRGSLRGTPIVLDTRYRDFREVYVLMKRTLGKTTLPVFPSKKIMGHMDTEFAEQRAHLLETWLNSLSANALRFRPLEEFLVGNTGEGAAGLSVSPPAFACAPTPPVGDRLGTPDRGEEPEFSPRKDVDLSPRVMPDGRVLEDYDSTPECTPAPSLASSQVMSGLGLMQKGISASRLNSALEALGGERSPSPVRSGSGGWQSAEMRSSREGGWGSGSSFASMSASRSTDSAGTGSGEDGAEQELGRSVEDDGGKTTAELLESME